jgi:putative DNA primase/helicase
MAGDLDRAAEALYYIPADTTRDEWVRTLMAAHAADLPQEVAEAWSAQAPTFNARAFRDTWRSIKPGRGIGPGTLFKKATEHGFRLARLPQEQGTRSAPSARPLAPVAPHAEALPFPDPCGAIWGGTADLRGSVAESYLQARESIVPPADGDLRAHPALRHRTGYTGPGMVGLITDAVTGERMGLHRTWTNADGSKPVTPAKMALGLKQGGVIRLWPDEAVTTGLGIAEGIESALSLAHAFRPVWSCIDAGNLAAFPVLPGIECLTIAADNDPAGIRAANACAERWHQAGREVRLVMPPAEGADLNDLAREVHA